MKRIKNYFQMNVTILIVTGLLSFFFYLPAEVTGSQSATPPEENRLKSDHAPTPFSAAEIRKGCPEGRTIRYRIETKEAADVFRVTTFMKCNEESAGFRSITRDIEGKRIGELLESRAEWEELQAHASFVANTVKITNETYKTPIGVFDCWLYTVTTEDEGSTTVNRFWFAKSLPGPPLCFETRVDGTLSMRMTMVENHYSRK